MSILQDIFTNLTESFEAIFKSPSENHATETTQELNTSEKYKEFRDGSIYAHGVEIPALVAKQLRELGHSIESYSASELRDAIAACAYDGTLIDDHEGINFTDCLTKDYREIQEDMYDDDQQILPYRRGTGKVSAPSNPSPKEKQSWAERINTPSPHNDFQNRIKEERASIQHHEQNAG